MSKILPPQHGEISGYPEGSEVANRRELFDANLHRHLQAGISGTGANGAYSIVLSGGYEDDEDFGDEIIYTGEGGRDQQTGRQVFNQTLTKGNLGLAKDATEGIPVRVIRGYTHRSPHSPRTGYRYDGLFRVAEYWKERGRSGFDVWRFRLLKIDSEADWRNGGSSAAAPPKRKESTILRIVRDGELSKAVKRLYDYRCQVCSIRIETPAGLYAEGAHIRPIGSPHNGTDTLDNILCLCPNHHVMFDNFGFALTDDLRLIGIAKPFHVRPDHGISIENVRYHREHRYKNPLNR